MIKSVLFDIDGVLTDGKVYISPKGEELKRLDFKDIDAVFALKRDGFLLAAITKENTGFAEYIKNRFPWDYFYQGETNKLDRVKEIETNARLNASELCYIGDGYNDLEPLDYVGLSVCPADAIPEVRETAKACLTLRGGDGCVWELRRLILERNKGAD